MTRAAGGVDGHAKVLADSPLQGDGFEPSVALDPGMLNVDHSGDLAEIKRAHPPNTSIGAKPVGFRRLSCWRGASAGPGESVRGDRR